MFSTSSGSVLELPPNHASRISDSSASDVARRLSASTLASFQRRAPRPRSARRRTAPRGCPAPCWRRSTRPSRSSTRRPPARPGRRPRRAPPLRSPTPSRAARRPRTRRAGAARARAGEAPRAAPAATPVSSSAATAIRIGRGSGTARRDQTAAIAGSRSWSPRGLDGGLAQSSNSHWSPYARMSSISGTSARPLSVSAYSTRGGTSGNV